MALPNARCTGALFGLLLGLAPLPLFAQQDGGLGNVGVVQSLILTVEPDRMFAQSAFGRRINRELEMQGTAIATENRRIEAELTREERELTEIRDTLAPEEFRRRAEAFDEKVQRLRREQDSKARALGQRNDEARRVFLNAAEPILAALMRESGAVAILDRRALLLSADSVDITDNAVSRIDAAIGDGAGLMPDAPRTDP